MTGPSNRRGFLRGLASLPLIGGGVALIGQPTRAAEPVSRELLLNYADWLFMERRVLLHELFQGDHEARMFAESYPGIGNTPGGHYHLPDYPVSWRDIPQPSSRAAVVLATVGCDWRAP